MLRFLLVTASEAKVTATCGSCGYLSQPEFAWTTSVVGMLASHPFLYKECLPESIYTAHSAAYELIQPGRRSASRKCCTSSSWDAMRVSHKW